MAMAYLTAERTYSLLELEEKINAIEGAEPVTRSVQLIGGVNILTLAYEKYYIRNSSYTSLTVVLTQHERSQTACVIGSGGKELLDSLGSDENFARACVQLLESCGFKLSEADFDVRKESLLKKIFK